MTTGCKIPPASLPPLRAAFESRTSLGAEFNAAFDVEQAALAVDKEKQSKTSWTPASAVVPLDVEGKAAFDAHHDYERAALASFDAVSDYTRSIEKVDQVAVQSGDLSVVAADKRLAAIEALRTGRALMLIKQRLEHRDEVGRA